MAHHDQASSNRRVSRSEAGEGTTAGKRTLSERAYPTGTQPPAVAPVPGFAAPPVAVPSPAAPPVTTFAEPSAQVLRLAEPDVRPPDEAAILAGLSASSGAALAPAVAAHLGAMLGHDFAHVRVHTDAVAAAAAVALGARAFTIGSDVYFAAGAYAPDSFEGESLLIHELTHVVQHDRGALAAVADGASRVSSPSDQHEHEAEAMARRPRAPAGDPSASLDPASGVTAGRSPGAGSAPAAGAPVQRAVHGVPNEGNDCFMASVLQVVATVYAPLFDLADNAVAPARQPVQAAVFAYLQRLRGADAPGFADGDTKRLRALLQAHKLIPSRMAQEDAAGFLRALITYVTELEGRVLEVGMNPPLYTQSIVAPAGASIPALMARYHLTHARLIQNNPSLGFVANGLFDQHKSISHAEGDGEKRALGANELDATQFDEHRTSRRLQADLSMVTVEMSEFDSFEQFMAYRYGAGVDVELDAKSRINGLAHDGTGVGVRKFHETLAFARLPVAMTFAVNRFGVDAVAGPVKFNDAFAMPDEVVLKQDADGVLTYKRYRLNGVVHHHGTEAGGGHYTAQVREIGAEDWDTANDAKVTRNRGGAERTDTGYLYTYTIAEESDAPLTVAAVQDAATKPRTKSRNSSGPSAWSGRTDAGTTAVESTDKRGLPNLGRNHQAKSDCFVNAVVQLAAGPYRDRFDPKKNLLIEKDDLALQKLVWDLVQKIHKDVPDPATTGEVAALRAALVERKIIKSSEGHEDASEVLLGLLGVVQAGQPPELAHQQTRTLDRSDSKPAEPDKTERAYQDGKAVIPEAGNGVLPIDIAQFGSLHQYLYNSFGGGGVRTTLDPKNRQRVTNTDTDGGVAQTMTVTGYVDQGRLTALPPVLTFNLKRLPVGQPPDLRNFYMPPALVLVQAAPDAPKRYVSYELQGVVTWQHAHYTARVAHGGKWYDFNDDRVTAATGTGDLLTHGYLYTYVATKTAEALPGSAVALQETRPSVGVQVIDDDLEIDFGSNAIVHRTTGHNLRAMLTRIGSHYPVLVDPDKGLAVAKVIGLIDSLGLLSASGLTAEDPRATTLSAGCRELATRLGSKTLAAAFFGDLAAPARAQTAYEERGALATAGFVYDLKSAPTDLTTKTMVELQAALKTGDLKDGPELQAYLQYRARKEFYQSVHLVYDLDQTLVTYTDGKYQAPSAPGDVTGTLEMDDDYDLPIDAVVPDGVTDRSQRAHYRQHGPPDPRDPKRKTGWRQTYLPKNTRERGEKTGKKVDTMGRELAEPSVSSDDVVVPTRAPTEATGQPTEATEPSTGARVEPKVEPKPTPVVLVEPKPVPRSEPTSSLPAVDHRPPPTNQSGKADAVRIMSVRPGAVESLNELDRYGVRQSVWTSNVAPHMHRVLELLERRGFAEHHFDQTIGGRADETKHKKPLDGSLLKTSPDQLTVLLDDNAATGNHLLGELDQPFGPLAGHRHAGLQVPAWGDHGSKYKVDAEREDLQQMMGDLLMAKLALAQVAPSAEADQPLARRYLDALKAAIAPGEALADAALIAALEKFLKVAKNRAALHQGFDRFQQPAPMGRTGEDPSLFALTPSLGTSAILPGKGDGSTAPDHDDAKRRFKAHNVVSRGLIETELHDQRRFVRVYQTEANPIPVDQIDKTSFKDVHQEGKGGAVSLVRGKGAVCFSVGTPLRALKWFEKYQEEHFGKGFNPVIRSFLIPLETYIDISSRANVQEQTSHPRFDGKDYSNNVDIAGDTDQYETRDADLERLRAAAVAGSLVSWALDLKRIAADVSGELRPVIELYDRLGIPPFYGIFTAARTDPGADTFDPFTEGGGHRAGALAERATQLGELHATFLERDGADPDAFVEKTRADGPPKRSPEQRTEGLADFLRLHFFNPPTGARFKLATELDTLKAQLEDEAATKAQTAEHDRLTQAASVKGDVTPVALPPKKVERLSHRKFFERLQAATDGPALAAYQAFVAARAEYRQYLAEQQQVAPAWDDLSDFYVEVLVPMVREKDRFATRMARIAEEHGHYNQGLRALGRPVPVWSDLEFFMRVLVPGAASQFAITAAIGANVDEARADLATRHPEHTDGFEERWEQSQQPQPPEAQADTPMKTLDYGARKADQARIRQGGDALTEAITQRKDITAHEVLALFLKHFPELAEKYAEESNRDQYLYAQHVERVIGQYLKHFRDGKHPLATLDAMVKMILFHDMDKFRGRTIHEGHGKPRPKDGKAKPSDHPDEVEVAIAQVVKHTGLSQAHVRARFDQRMSREKGHGDHADLESAAEHVLPAMMMERYAALWRDPNEARLMMTMMDGDPIGSLAKKAKPKGKAGEEKPTSAGELAAHRKGSFMEVIEMAGRAGIPSTDHAGIAAYYYQLLQFYQADSSSYSTEGHHTGETAPSKRNATFDNIYERTSASVVADSAVHGADAVDGSAYQGFLQFHDPHVAAAVGELTAMFAQVGKHLHELVRERAASKTVGKKKEKAVAYLDQDDLDPGEGSYFDLFSDDFGKRVGTDDAVATATTTVTDPLVGAVVVPTGVTGEQLQTD